MNPFQKNKVDMSLLTPDEQKAFRMYGKLPNRKDVLQNKLKERKYFDSGDYALSKAGKTSEISPTDVGREHPIPENIPHLSTSPSTSSIPHSGGTSSERGSFSAGSGPTSGAVAAGIVGIGAPLAPTTTSSSASSASAMGGHTGASPVKESSSLQREETIDDQPGEGEGADDAAGNKATG